MKWSELYKIINRFNEDKEEGEEPLWSADCGMKVDFDGPLVQVESRFYPNSSYNGEPLKWGGGVRITVLHQQTIEKVFPESSLESLKVRVEDYIKDFSKKIKIG